MIVEIALMLNFQTLAMKSYEGYRIFSFPVSNEIQKEALRKLVKSVRKLKKNINDFTEFPQPEIDWLYPHRQVVKIGQTVQLMIPPKIRRKTFSALANLGNSLIKFQKFIFFRFCVGYQI